jgi:hypothetical protein
MFLNFELSLFPSKTLTLFKEYAEINKSILLQNLLYFCFACTCVLQLKNYNQQIGIRAIVYLEGLVS